MAEHDHLAVPMTFAGPPLGEAPVAAVALHGRGHEPGYMLDQLVGPLDADDVSWVLPAAAGRTWYPHRFTSPRETNEPAFGQALAACRGAVDRIGAAGVPPERTVLVGFSQGGCILADFVAGSPRPYAGVGILYGALCGPDGAMTAVAPLDGLEILLATGRYDSWVAFPYVELTAEAFAAAGGRVDLRVTDEPEHRIGAHAVAGVAELLERARGRGG